MIGIYSIKNVSNGKEYVGRSTNINERWQNHRRLLLKNKHENFKLQKDYNLYGAECFKYSILEECGPDELKEKEAFWINLKRTKEHGYNLCDGGAGINNPLEEVRKKISNGLKGEKNGMYGIRLIGEQNPNYGKTHTKESREKMSAKAKLRVGEKASRSRKVRASTGEIFCSSTEAMKWCGADNSSIGKVCKNKAKTAGKHPVTGEQLSWQYI